MAAPAAGSVQATALQYLEMYKVKTNAAWVHQACSFMPHLTALKMQSCLCGGHAGLVELDQPPLETLRYLLLTHCCKPALPKGSKNLIYLVLSKVCLHLIASFL